MVAKLFFPAIEGFTSPNTVNGWFLFVLGLAFLNRSYILQWCLQPLLNCVFELHLQMLHIPLLENWNSFLIIQLTVMRYFSRSYMPGPL